MSPEPKRRGRPVPLHTKILTGLAIGAVAGVASNLLWQDAPALLWIVDNVAQPLGQIFLRMLFMVVVPLVFTSLTLGVATLGDLSRVGRIGGKSIGFFLLTTAMAATLGLLLVNVVQPGAALDPGIRNALLEQYSSQAAEKAELAISGGFGVNTFVNIVPRNPIDAMARGDMLGLIFFALVFGIALTMISREKSEPVIKVLDGIGEAVMVMIGFAMKIAPVGVAGLIFAVTARFGFEVLQSLGLYVVVVLGALALHQFAVIPSLAKLLVGISPGTFLRRARALMVTAFSTSSSNATLPTTIRTAEQQFGVPKEVAGFVLPLGATMNMNGTALFEGMTVLFLAQVFGIALTLPQQVVVVAMSVITAVGVAGVPGGSIPLLMMVLGMVGVPPEGIALVLGVDRILDMARTVPNVTGDLLTSLVVTRSEKLPFVMPGSPAAEAVVEEAALAS
ncbi:MAG TPA: dicarboxylate/amino acid:cation symporter [Longimicrobiaceae bacterium]|jgi:DAACS family dicarboxylate/amino acid:cation (Na+ or H+) symporter|nr:dicarboxylate/amino acid:cation symporter [Longimicrobiaceae bacterium]